MAKWVDLLAAYRRAALVLFLVGAVQLAGVLLGPSLVDAPSATSDGASSVQTISETLTGWRLTILTVAVLYLLTSVFVPFRVAAAVWLAMIGALAQAIVLGMLVVFAIMAGFRAGSPGTMTLGVLCFGTMAAVHLFVLRNLWIVR